MDTVNKNHLSKP